MTIGKKSILCAGLLLAMSCSRPTFVPVAGTPDIFPDYVGVTVPEGMAPLTFAMKDGRKASWTSERVGDTLFYRVRAWNKGERTGQEYEPFKVFVSKDAIDPYIAYRLIEPNYESWRFLGIYSRELSSYKETPIVENSSTGGGCLNCHNFAGGDPSRMMFHARGAGGGTVFRNGDEVHILNLATVGPERQGTYPAWHPSGRYIAFSSNSTQQSFPIRGSQPVEVFDHFSDIILFDTETEEVSTYAPLFGDGEMETFPAWSEDGRTLYYCSAPQVEDVGANRGSIRYSLKAVDFEDGHFVGEPRTAFLSDSLSVSHPRISGRWLLFTASAYGTFPIWHDEADLWLMDLEDGSVRRVDELNSDESDSYHSWSGNGRWIVFSSRRIDGRFTRLYFSHFDGEGHFSKPFLLPQKDPSHNLMRLKSYNVPEFVKGDPGNLDRQVGKLFGK